MIDSIVELRAFAQLKNGDVHNVLKLAYEKLSQHQRSIKDEIDLRWNQGKQQMLFEILQIIDEARDRSERLENKSAVAGTTATSRLKF